MNGTGIAIGVGVAGLAAFAWTKLKPSAPAAAVVAPNADGATYKPAAAAAPSPALTAFQRADTLYKLGHGAGTAGHEGLVWAAQFFALEKQIAGGMPSQHATLLAEGYAP